MEENKTTQPRKQYAKRGEKSSKMLSFRIDSDNLAWLNTQPNKGRVINDLIAQAREREKDVG